jgi:hypothetical protein
VKRPRRAAPDAPRRRSTLSFAARAVLGFADAGGAMKSFLPSLATLLRSAFQRERLPPPPPRVEPPDRRPSVMRLLFTPEPLPQEPPRPARRGSRILAWLFSPEPLPLDPPFPAVRRSRWLAALFAPERLDGDPPAPGGE